MKPIAEGEPFWIRSSADLLQALAARSEGLTEGEAHMRSTRFGANIAAVSVRCSLTGTLAKRSSSRWLPYCSLLQRSPASPETGRVS